ncbi:MAG TPA: phenylalanine--tRNA ligase subunit alpha [Chloroflexota bacterium]
MLDRLQELKTRALGELASADSPQQLQDWRVLFLGKKGPLTEVLRELGRLPADERPAAGQAANAVKVELEAAFESRERQINARELSHALEAERIDVTLPGRPPTAGYLHPITQTINQITSVFASMGYHIVEGPEVESDYYNFQALNIPPEHPAREMWDTFYVRRGEGQDVLLRTQTSPMQIRFMEKTAPPVRMVSPGRCYRYEAQDASHESMFYQVEGLAVDEGITLADLKGTLTLFAHRMFGPDVNVRFRCDYFPFVEPGVEMSVTCVNCHGSGCRVCKGTGWLEIMGAGMVHTKVLAGVGYDPERYTGFAFGMGPERVAMLRYKIDDIRLFYGNDLRFLRQFA